MQQLIVELRVANTRLTDRFDVLCVVLRRSRESPPTPLVGGVDWEALARAIPAARAVTTENREYFPPSVRSEVVLPEWSAEVAFPHSPVPSHAVLPAPASGRQATASGGGYGHCVCPRQWTPSDRKRGGRGYCTGYWIYKPSSRQ